MKKTVLMTSVVGLSILTIGGVNAGAAASYPSATEAKGEGYITFNNGKPEIVDPTDPDIPVTPDEPSNPSDADLRIQYVSDFQFGDHDKSVQGVTALSSADQVKLINDKNKLKNVPSFISTMDMRTERQTGWTLSVTSSTFKNSKGHEIDGGEVTLSDARYEKADEFSPVISPVVSSKSGQALTPGTSYKIAGADASKKQGIGTYSLAFGELVDDHTSGVTFKMGPKTVVDADTYKATFDWNLAPTLNLD